MTERQDQTKEAILLFCDAIDAATTQLRKNLGANPFKNPTIAPKQAPAPEVKPSAVFDGTSWNPKNMTWTAGEGPAGKLLVTEDVSNVEFKKCLKLLGEAGGNIYGVKEEDGQYHYWSSQRGDKIYKRRKDWQIKKASA